MSKLVVLVGLSGSGKSTLAKELKDTEKAVIVSSDSIREELFGDVNNQDNNRKVFEEMNNRANRYLSEGVNVVYDATNINRKKRIHLINNVIKADEYEVYYVATPYYQCVRRNNKRARKVPENVIKNMYKSVHIPTLLEGWDRVKFHYPEHVYEDRDVFTGRYPIESLIEDILEVDNHDELFDTIKYQLGMHNKFEDIHDVPHDSSYHSFSISRHTFHVVEHLKEQRLERSYELLLAALFHDLGKGFCKSFYNHRGEKRKYASYIGHESVSSQLAIEILFTLGLKEEKIKYVVDLIQFHMKPMDMSAKTERNLKKLLSDKQFEDLMLLHEADLQAK